MAKPKKKKPAKRKPAKKPTAQTLEQAKAEADELALLEYYRRIKRGDTLKPYEHKHRRELEAKRDRESATPAIGDNLADAAALMDYAGWSRRMVSYHITAGNVRQNADGSFDKKIVDAYLAKRAGKEPPADDPDQGLNECGEPIDLQAKKADLRWRNARAEKEELLVEQVRESLFSKAEVVTEWTERVLTVCAGLEALADRLPPLLAGLTAKEMQPIIKNEIRLLREGYARDGKYTPES